MAVMQRPVLPTQEGFGAIYAYLISKVRSKSHEEALELLRNLEKHCDEAAALATRILREAIRRDLSQQNDCVKKSQELRRDIERISGLFFESRLWYLEGGISNLEAMYRNQEMGWRQNFRHG